MLSYNNSKDGIIVAVFDSDSHKNKSKYVFYDETKINENLNENDEQEIKKALYGNQKARYLKPMKQLKMSENANIFVNPPNSKNKGAFYPFYPQNIEGFRTIIYLSGKGGSGKSYLAKKLSFYFNKLMNVYILSPVRVDDAKEQYVGEFLNLSDLVILDDNNDYEVQKKSMKMPKFN